MSDYEYPLTMTGGHTRSQIIAKMHERLSDGRFKHCLRVEETSRQLARRFNVDVDTAGLAGLLHDYAKEISPEAYRDVIVAEGYGSDLLQYGRGVWHGVVGTWFLQQDLGISNPGVIRAINRHTTGHPDMTALDMIVFVADFIEPARSLDGEIKARKAAESSLEQATMIELQNTLGYLVSQGALIHPLTFATYNAFTKRLQTAK
ncbi:bis(5'-nucleosyl)-tetraphosphatase (symmetrical) YqeK [Lacticaseibacillus sharpeae]|uniref:bis(5'-nucleosyl)-tetraphosphatase (symmetrical) n=1 Tax=Lacticaseibacillus sharpeae JCM 1186 = DSM 20505 TaxID=1291052 RepID=A0A0R1ZT65_9LACO|nr:bis(5'-nucleosyl)-tetraphosphatase (symmetrical) YqeK [Lacticaseibacillus sharpeae]KRM56404.1 HD superfamily NAD metabolism hydrolase [Lacticaseibacillus sharpeae JCM 1186 = DSM 20505]